MDISRGDHTTRIPFAKNITRFSRGKHQNLVSPGRRRRRKFRKNGAPQGGPQRGRGFDGWGPDGGRGFDGFDGPHFDGFDGGAPSGRWF